MENIMGILKMFLIIAAMFGTIVLTNRLLGEKKDQWFHLRWSSRAMGITRPSQSFNFGAPKTWQGLLVMIGMLLAMAVQIYIITALL